MDLFPKEMMASSNLTAERIYAALISLEVEAHFLHLTTKSFAEHKATDELYSGISGFRDTIMENILGHMAGKGTSLLPPKGISVKTGRSANEVARELCDFAYQLHEWSEEQDWYDLTNISDELCALGTKVQYLLTLS